MDDLKFRHMEQCLEEIVDHHNALGIEETEIEW